MGGQDEAVGQSHSLFCNLILEIMPHHFCSILFVRSQSLGPGNTQGEELHEGVSTRRQGLLRAFLEDAHIILHEVYLKVDRPSGIGPGWKGRGEGLF